MDVKCLDTYALVEILEGNPKYAGYLSEQVMITQLTLAEFHSVVLRGPGKEVADHWFNALRSYAVPCSLDILKEAVEFRFKHRRGISFFDAVGYVFALNKKAVFVTGDKEFKDMPGVEWVSK